jgi:hypothetical protein
MSDGRRERNAERGGGDTRLGGYVTRRFACVCVCIGALSVLSSVLFRSPVRPLSVLSSVVWQ